MPRVKDLTGQRFGRLVAKEATDYKKRGYIVWRCQCDCGNTTYVPSGSLSNGITQSCGCLARDAQFAAGKLVPSPQNDFGISGASKKANMFILVRSKDGDKFYFGTFENLSEIKKIDQDIKDLSYPELLDYFVEHFPQQWPLFRKNNGGNIRRQKNTYSVRVRKNNYRFYVGGVKSEVEAFKIRNLVNNMSWEDFSEWYSERFPDAWTKYVQESLKKPYTWKLTLLRLDDAELIKKLEESDDTNKLIRDALYAYLK